MEKNIANATARTSRFVCGAKHKAELPLKSPLHAGVLSRGIPTHGPGTIPADKHQPVLRSPWAARSPCLTWTLWMMGWSFGLPGGRQAKAALSTPGDAKALGTPEERWERSARGRPARRLSPRVPLPATRQPAASPGEVGCSANQRRCPGWGDRAEAHLPAR